MASPRLRRIHYHFQEIASPPVCSFFKLAPSPTLSVLSVLMRWIGGVFYLIVLRFNNDSGSAIVR
jgi:hypothetical protein